MTLVGAQTLVSSDQQPFNQMLNVGLDTSVIQVGTVLAHESAAKVDGNVVGGVGVVPDTDQGLNGKDSWADALCSENQNLFGAQRSALHALLLEFGDFFSRGKFDIGCTTLLSHDIDTGPERMTPSTPSAAAPPDTLLGGC
ncbi:unnamed protein product [Lampetra fluviatilis]